MVIFGLTRSCAAVLLSGLACVAAQASATTYTLSGTASGMVGNESVAHDPRVWVPFTDTAFTFTARADLDGFTPTPTDVIAVPLGEVLQITLQGLGQFIAVDDFALIIDHPDDIGALSSGDGNVEFTSPQLTTYDGTSSFGPIAVQTFALNGSFNDVELEPSSTPPPTGLLPGTELTLILTGVSALTFGARTDVPAVPEPTIAWLMAPGLLALVGVRRRGRRTVS